MPGLKAAMRWPLHLVGLDVVRRNRRPEPGRGWATWSDRLAHARSLGFSPKVILDGGAFHGLWATEAARLFPGAQLILVEPNPNLRLILARAASSINPTPQIVEAALGADMGTATLNIWRSVDNDAGASLLRHVQGTAAAETQVQVDTIDNIVASRGVSPDLVKLDLQGGELAALRGARTVLRSAEMLVVEFGCIEAYVGRTTPRDLLDFVYANDYVLYDIFDWRYRPYDGALGGGDFCFVKRDSPLRAHKGWG